MVAHRWEQSAITQQDRRVGEEWLTKKLINEASAGDVHLVRADRRVELAAAAARVGDGFEEGCRVEEGGCGLEGGELRLGGRGGEQQRVLRQELGHPAVPELLIRGSVVTR